MTIMRKVATRDAIQTIEDAVAYNLAVLTTCPTAVQREALEALPADDIAPARICNELDMEPGSTWGQVRRDILGGLDGEMRWYEVNVTRTAPFRLVAKSAEQAEALILEWLEDDGLLTNQPPGLEQYDSWWDQADAEEAEA